MDTTSEAFFALLAESLNAARILVLGTYRPGYRPPWLEQSNATQIALQRLTREDSLVVIRSLAPPERLPEPMVQTILTKAPGSGSTRPRSGPPGGHCGVLPGGPCRVHRLAPPDVCRAHGTTRQRVRRDASHPGAGAGGGAGRGQMPSSRRRPASNETHVWIASEHRLEYAPMYAYDSDLR